MTRKEERVAYAMSLQGKGMENDELRNIIRLAILDGAQWADKTLIDKACQWLKITLPLTPQAVKVFVTDFRKAMED